MNPKISFYKQLIENYQGMVALCLTHIEISNDPFWWEERRVMCEAKISEAERIIGIIELKAELETIHQKLSA